MERWAEDLPLHVLSISDRRIWRPPVGRRNPHGAGLLNRLHCGLSNDVFCAPSQHAYRRGAVQRGPTPTILRFNSETGSHDIAAGWGEEFTRPRPGQGTRPSSAPLEIRPPRLRLGEVIDGVVAAVAATVDHDLGHEDPVTRRSEPFVANRYREADQDRADRVVKTWASLQASSCS